MLKEVANLFRAAGNAAGNALDRLSGERQLAEQVFKNYLPANEPGASYPMLTGKWYRAINERGETVGFMWNCACGQTNLHLCGVDDIRRRLEMVHHCAARCAGIEWEKDDNGQPKMTGKVVYTEQNAAGIEVPAGAPYSLLSILPDEGTNMSELERNKVYSLLPTWRVGPRAGQHGSLHAVFDDPCDAVFDCTNAKTLVRAADRNDADPFVMMSGFGGKNG